ncbi:hypothetical protein QNH48_17295 [Neobacillus sp. YX16]|uniref:hypothetical protein n=1 Tax=Neobacillus sp. YX16 TaxID=3047874 RepID=UPI00105A7C7C|nr:hypothetical protein [Neobacillus sp. YX16]TDL75517.1 hypothetical protein E2R56_06850 [Rhodococcus qingshengii]WHZ00800.1 hypothetical protein QNH48_17295 [Neobacillus sp. YX16]
MKTIWKITLLTILSIGLLSGCNSAEKRDSLNQENDVNFRPVRNERKTNVNESNNDYKNQENRRFLHDESPEQTDDEMEKGNDLEFNKNRGAE